MPALSREAKEAECIVGCIEGSGLEAEAGGFPGAIENGQAVDAVVAAAIGQGDDEGQLTAMLEAVGGEFKDAMAIDPALAIAVPSPQGVGVVVSP
jgi:hypothetical protein